MSRPTWEDPVPPKQVFDDLRMQIDEGWGNKVAAICASIICVCLALAIGVFIGAIILAWAFEIASWILR